MQTRSLRLLDEHSDSLPCGHLQRVPSPTPPSFVVFQKVITMEVTYETTQRHLPPQQNLPQPGKDIIGVLENPPLFPATSTPLFLLPLCSPHSPPHEHLPGPISPGPAPITTSAWQLFKPTDSYLTEAFVLYCLFYVKKCLLSWKSTLENCAAISKWSTGLITPTCSSN